MENMSDPSEPIASKDSEHNDGFVNPLRPDNWDQPTEIPSLGNVARILVPIDGSEPAELGLAHGARIAAWTGAEIIVVVAYDPPSVVRRRGMLPPDSLRQAMEDDAKELAGEAVTLLIERGLSARAVVMRGDPADVIVDIAETDRVDLIVMGRRGLRAMKRLFLGSVSERVLRTTDVSVMVVA
jgi:nucleotide-binding universal stress UspA family protein